MTTLAQEERAGLLFYVKAWHGDPGEQRIAAYWARQEERLRGRVVYVDVLRRTGHIGNETWARVYLKPADQENALARGSQPGSNIVHSDHYEPFSSK